LLVQRLDAVLGTQLAQHGKGSLADRPDAVSPPGGAVESGDPQSGAALDPNSPQAKAAIRDAALQAELAAAARARYISTDTTRSAPTSLGQTARTILTLLAQYPETAPAVAGKAALWVPAVEENDNGGPPTTLPGAGTQGLVQEGSPQTSQAVAAAPGKDQDQGGPAGQGPNTNIPDTAEGANGAPARAATAAGAPAANAAAAALDSIAVQAGDDAAATSVRAQGPANAGGPAAGSAVRAPDLPTPGPQPHALAQALAGALQRSGLFYESHISDVAYGRRDPTQLAHEPQAALDPGEAPRINPAGENRSILADNVRFSLPTSASPMMPQADGLPSGGSAPTWSGSQPSLPPVPPPGIHPEAALLVRQQLEVLANQTVAWEGTAWPGAPMWWEISREQEDAMQGPRAAPRTWATRIVLTLPRLGSVETRISLAGDQLVMQIVAPDGDAEISRATAALRERMSASGLTLSDVSVSAVAPGLEEIL
jgi:hypothetical protein